MENVNYIITAKHYSINDGADGTVRGRILKQRDALLAAHGVRVTINNIDMPAGKSATARIWQGQWIADCPDCSGAEFVAPDEPIFFCQNCFNRGNNNRPRPVIFPDIEIRAEIERLILERPVNDIVGLRDVDRAGGAQPVIFVEVSVDGNTQILPLRRDWLPGETIEDLRLQNKPIQAWRDAQKGGE